MRGRAALAGVARPWSIQPSPWRLPPPSAPAACAKRRGTRSRPSAQERRYASSPPLRGRAAGSARRISAGVDRARAGRFNSSTARRLLLWGEPPSRYGRVAVTTRLLGRPFWEWPMVRVNHESKQDPNSMGQIGRVSVSNRAAGGGVEIVHPHWPPHTQALRRVASVPAEALAAFPPA